MTPDKDLAARLALNVIYGVNTDPPPEGWSVYAGLDCVINKTGDTTQIYTLAVGLAKWADARADQLGTRAEADAMVAAAWEAAAVIADDAAYDNDAEASRFRSGSNPHWAKVCEAKLHRAIAAAIRAAQPAPAKGGE